MTPDRRKELKMLCEQIANKYAKSPLERLSFLEGAKIASMIYYSEGLADGSAAVLGRFRKKGRFLQDPKPCNTEYRL